MQPRGRPVAGPEVMAVPFILFGGACCFSLLVMLPYLIGLYKVFVKAGKPGWAAFVPIYNFIVLLEITGQPLWYLAICLIPGGAFVVKVMVDLELAKCFRKEPGFAIGLILLAPVFFPILGFDSSRYRPPAGASRYGADDDDRPRRRRDEYDDDEEPQPRRRRPRPDDDD